MTVHLLPEDSGQARDGSTPATPKKAPSQANTPNHPGKGAAIRFLAVPEYTICGGRNGHNSMVSSSHSAAQAHPKMMD